MYYPSRDGYEFISKKSNPPTGQAGDPIVQRKICTISGNQFPIYQSDLDLYNKISPVFNGVKYEIPTPTLCPEERRRRRSTFTNERKLYKRKCDASGKDIISIYSADKPYKIYANEYRRSDKRDAMSYGRDFDFSKTFTENFRALHKEVPKDQLTKEFTQQENCDYTNAS